METISKESILNKLSEISRNTGLILGLAGSYARGTNDKDSDIDIVVDTKGLDIIIKSTHNRRERPIHGHRGGSRGRFYYRITTFEERPWDARDPHKTTFMALSHAIGLSI